MTLSSRLLPLLLSLLFVLPSGCSGVRYIYSQLDWIVPWYVRDYVDLDHEQRVLLDNRLAVRLEWHCRAHLPVYAAWLRRLEADVRVASVDVGLLGGYVEEAAQLWQELAAKIAADVPELLASLSDVQVAGLFEVLDERNEEAREAFLEGTPEELIVRRAERMEKRLRRWLGRLNAEQRTLIEAWSGELEDVTREWFDNRLHWQARLKQVLDGRGDPAFAARLAELIITPAADWPERYREQVAANRERTLMLLVNVHAGLSERQREYLKNELASLATQFERFACEDESPGIAGLG